MKLIKIGTSWCSGCIVMKPIFEKIETKFNIKSEYYDFDIYEDMLIEKYNINDHLPVFIFLDNNNIELERIIGETTEDNLVDLINKYKDE